MDDFQEVVCARLQTLPADFNISIGDYGTITKQDALKHVKNNDEIGKLFIQINRNYFDSIKSGKIYASINK